MNRSVFFLLALVMATTQAASTNLELQELAPGVYALVGETGNRSPGNLGNNSTHGFIVTDEGVVVIDPGGSYRGAQAIHARISEVTDQPIKVVINTGGQDHRWLGNGYFRELGAQIIANRNAVADQQARVQDQLMRLNGLVGSEGMTGTDPVFADTLFDDYHEFQLGGTEFQLHHAGQAHTPGDSFVWLPAHRIVFSGDIVYTGRMLGIADHSSSSTWLEAFEAMASLKPETVVPGHGSPVSLEKARKDSYDYIAHLRQAVAAFMDAGGDISEIADIDQSAFAYLENFDTLAGRNAQRVYEELEWE